MNIFSGIALQKFKNLVGIRFQLYNSLFTSLPFHRIEKTGVLLSLFLIHCEESYSRNESPVELIESFFKQYTSITGEKEKLDLLFRFVQYSERQVVLFDALEDAAFSEVNDLNGAGSLKQLQSQVEQSGKENLYTEKLKDFSVRIVLTAHPTQFYTGEVLGIIHDLSKALADENVALINQYLQQLGRTPFLKKEKPAPFDEAMSLMWYLENIFYAAAGRISSVIKNNNFNLDEFHPVIRMGFWPGGDRDGNPFVTAETTVKVASALNKSILKCYYHDVRKLKRRLTFKGVEEVLLMLEKQLYNAVFKDEGEEDLSKEEMLETLQSLKMQLIGKHNSLFIDHLENFISKVETFGLFFATLDVRQDSSVHELLFDEVKAKSNLLPQNFDSISDKEKITALNSVGVFDSSLLEDPLLKDTLDVVRSIKTIQSKNGEEACNRYIISHCTSALNMLEVYALFLMTGWKKEEMHVDIVPLFETIEDLQNASNVMAALYADDVYRAHLKLRNHTQTIMLGFSDGTKDGGYLAANWSIYKAKELLTKISADNGIAVIFFDGRGGPPARGGGKTHKFFASLGKNISSKEIQLTVQGQTVSSNFGTIDSAQYNIEQLINAGIANELFSSEKIILDEKEEELIIELSKTSFESYSALKNHPSFLQYLSDASALKVLC